MAQKYFETIPVGDLHMHTTFSDGQNTMEEMVQKALTIGHHYIAFTDHAGILPVESLSTEEKFALYFAEIEKIQVQYPQIRILKGVETNILQNGELDLEEKYLQKMEIVIGSIHHFFSFEDQIKNTRRYLKALDNPYLNILGHPTTRRSGTKEALVLDYQEVFEKAKSKNVALELNVTPDRMDLPIELLKLAKKIGNKIVMNTDSHQTNFLENLKTGLPYLQKAGLEKSDVLNYLEAEEVLKYFKKTF